MAYGTEVHFPFEISTSLLRRIWLLLFIFTLYSLWAKSCARFKSDLRFLRLREISLVSPKCGTEFF